MPSACTCSLYTLTCLRCFACVSPRLAWTFLGIDAGGAGGVVRCLRFGVHIRGACFDTPDEPAGRRWRTTQAGVSRRLIGADRSVTRHTWQPAKISSAAVRPSTHSVLASTDTTRQAEDAGAFDQDLTMWCVSCLRNSLTRKAPRVARVRSPRCSAERRVRRRYLVQLTISVHNGVVESHLENIERDPMLLGSPLGSLEYARPYG